MLLGVVRLLVARQRGNLPEVTEQARRLQAVAEAPEAAQPGLGEELRALVLINLGITEFWAARLEEAERHLEQGVTLARRIGRPYLEFTGLAFQAAIKFFFQSSYASAAERSRQAVELARRHGWTDEPAAGIAYLTLALVLAGQSVSLYVDIEKKLPSFTLKAKLEKKDEALGFLGESGSGKSMTLRCIAGLEKPTRGKIILNDRVLFDSEKKINLSTQERNVGFLFQNYALFPHMTVAQNIELGLSHLKKERKRKSQKNT